MRRQRSKKKLLLKRKGHLGKKPKEVSLPLFSFIARSLKIGDKVESIFKEFLS